MKKISIKTLSSNYPVVIGSRIFHQLSEHLHAVGINEEQKILIVTDENVSKLHRHTIQSALKSFQIFFYVIKPGETSKNLKVVEDVISFAIEKRLDRTSTILAFGGGVVGDLAGFVASIYMRGINFVQLPTTILAHDSSVGGKVAVNHSLGKNLIGSFYQPKLVFYDTSFLTALPDREVKSGLAEVIKHSLIADSTFAKWLYQHADSLLALEEDKINQALLQGIQIKAEVVKQDEREQGIRAILNFGHTFGHAVENISQYKYLHGEAVAIGMVYSTKLAHQLGMIDYKLVDFVKVFIQRFDLPCSIPKSYDNKHLIDIMLRDKKFSGNHLKIILPTQLGKVTIYQDTDLKLLEKTINLVKKL